MVIESGTLTALWRAFWPSFPGAQTLFTSNVLRTYTLKTTTCVGSSSAPHSAHGRRLWFIRTRGFVKFDCGSRTASATIGEDREHIAYREACVQLLKALISEFMVLSHGVMIYPVTFEANRSTINDCSDFNGIFLNVVESKLLQHCHLDTEVLSLCHSFFDCALQKPLARSLGTSYVYTNRVRLEAKLLEWIESFPDRFADKGESMKAQVLSLPWSQWASAFK
ncbi:hypothetical protein PM082_023202 [Marasmius tenuissimus]|nr:hypothetical protein PM082_023202 [Marasmius tenuissimus]